MIGEISGVTECEAVRGIGGHNAAVKNAGVADHVMIGGIAVGPGNGGSGVYRKRARHKSEVGDVDGITGNSGGSFGGRTTTGEANHQYGGQDHNDG